MKTFFEVEIKKVFIEVDKSDIMNIGHTAFNENGNLSIICKLEKSNFEKSLLRNILKCFGEQYKIVNTRDFDGYNQDDIVFETNLPYSNICKYCKY